ncbi:hypothetical protein SY83_09350 [Paenibacillus swuensis]|uniref:DUF2178 domain-containing protein n=1 Tax=Paenibacillus swuensis TaxID=1178515 RepID=A0A172THS9_9BACL|nr:hypothetical protein [Paenibacillus swuensis]ANE46444.1 hypothetical protein SY83_09350 [Paenibacillus swuensis]
MNKTVSAFFITVVGVGLLAVGVYFIKTVDDPQGILRALPYLCVGLGCGMFGHGTGEILIRSAKKRAPAAAKQLEIDEKDERNQAIANRAKAKAYDMMVFVLGALILSISLMGIDIIVVLLLVFAYMIILGYNSYYRYKYFKEM